MGTRSNSADMRYWGLPLIATLMVGCGGNQGISHHTRMDGRHFKLGKEIHLETAVVLATDPPTCGSDQAMIRTEQAVLAQNDRTKAEVNASTGSTAVTTAQDRLFMDLGRSPHDPDIRGQPGPTERIADPQTDQEEDTARTKWNPFAVAAPVLFIAALAMAIPLQSTGILLIGCALAFASAIIGARQCRDRGERGQGFAMSVLGLALAGVLIAAVALLARL